jgi:hypothetical protein
MCEQDDEIGLVGVGDGEGTVGGCNTRILMHLYRWDYGSALGSVMLV